MPNTVAQRVELAATAPIGAMQVDFAHVVGTRLFAYGWIVGLADSVSRAVLCVGEVVVDLMVDAAHVKREDVSHHFKVESTSDEHGFLVLLELPDLSAAIDMLRLEVRTRGGEAATTRWPIMHSEELALASLSAHEKVLRPLIPNMSPHQVRLLADLAATSNVSLRARDLEDIPANAAPAPKPRVQLCCLLASDLLVVVARLPHPLAECTAITLRCGGNVIELLDGLRPDGLAKGAQADRGAQVVFIGGPHRLAASDERNARIVLGGPAGTSTTRVSLVTEPSVAWTHLLGHLATVDANARIDLLERVADALGASPSEAELAGLLARQANAAARELPQHLDVAGPAFRARMYFDMAVPVGQLGVFVVGWFDADADAPVRVVYRSSSSEFCVSDHWIRRARADVSAHLASLGITPHAEPGFACFIPFAQGTSAAYLSVSAADAPVHRLKWPAPAATESAIKTIRSVLSAIDPHRVGVRRMLDEHVGPAVKGLWAARKPPAVQPTIEAFGPAPSSPLVSVIVPLFGRHDFADCQLALFADDADFRQVELIYVVDDPAIVGDFHRQCPHLFGLYGVPFKFAYSGANLGFAGANNFGASIARAPYLLLLNSDVFPSRPGWLRNLLDIYKARPDTGLLGAKLLYEDGSVQHAGMASRRHVPWQGLWINHHPHKGMSPAPLTGLHEVESVTAACALIETSLYRELGGLSEDYIVGDFEDSDLCHRARHAGRRNRVALDVTLYHLERQSQALGGDHHWRAALTLYNCWLHNRRWGAVIEGGTDGR